MVIERMLLAGSWVERPEWSTVTDPESGDEIGRVPVAAAVDVDVAVEAAQQAMQRGFPSYQRIAALSTAADLLAERDEEAATLIAREGIKTIREARSEVNRCVNTLRLSSIEAAKLGARPIDFDQVQAGEPFVGYATREPIGVIAAITPFNDPLNLVAHKVGPALAGGNAVIVKPDSSTPLSALLLVSILEESGVPNGYVQVLPGPGSVIGAALASHPGIRMVSFTGGIDVGRQIQQKAGIKYLGMELGANNGVIVMDDADIDEAVSRCVGGAFAAAGQNCLHVQRIFVGEAVREEFEDKFVLASKELRTGPKLDESTDMGPLISTASSKRIAGMVNEAIDQGGLLLTGGPATGVNWEPTVIADAPPDSRLQTEEVYGPVTLLESFRSVDYAIDRVNSTDYGLHAAVFTQDIDMAMTVASRLDTGGVLINESTDFRIDSMPFGGRRLSGLGREGVPYSVEAMTEPKLVAVRTKR